MTLLPKGATAHNVAEIVPHPETGDLVLSRIPEKLRVTLNDFARRNALHSAGCEIRCRLAGPSATLRLRACQDATSKQGGGLAQILFGDFSSAIFPVGTELVTLEIKAPDYAALERAAPSSAFHPRLLRILLPTHAAMSQIEIDGDILPPEPGDVPARRLLIYGSSITQGNGSLTTRDSWAGRCANRLGVDLVNLGFGGGCHCEPEMADYLAQRDDFDLAVLETGINMRDLDPGVTDERIAHLLRTFAAAHPRKPVFCVGVFPCANDFIHQYGGRVQQMREVVKAVVAEVNSPFFRYLDGTKSLDPFRDLSTDLVHPSPTGMTSIGEWVAAEILAAKPESGL